MTCDSKVDNLANNYVMYREEKRAINLIGLLEIKLEEEAIEVPSVTIKNRLSSFIQLKLLRSRKEEAISSDISHVILSLIFLTSLSILLQIQP